MPRRARLWIGEPYNAMLLQFPTDILLYILSFAPVHDLCSLQLVSRQVYHFICDHEDSVYHQAAILHKFAPPEVSLDEVKRTEARESTWLDDVRTWKELCACMSPLKRYCGRLTHCRSQMDCFGAQLGRTRCCAGRRIHVRRWCPAFQG